MKPVLSKLSIIVLMMFALAANAVAQGDLPTKDLEGSKDSPLLKRYEGSLIVAYYHSRYDEFTFPLSILEAVPGKRDERNNAYYEPKQKKTLEGPYTRLVYLTPENRSPLEVLRNYQDEIESAGGNILYECKDADCGGDPTDGTGSGGGLMSLSMYLFPASRITDKYGSPGHCAVNTGISGQRYFVAELPQTNTHVSVLTYSITGSSTSTCSEFADRTIAVVDMVEGEAREQKMVTVDAAEMSQQIANTGSVSLYGIYFDTDKAVVKPESDPTLEEIAKLLKDNSSLKLLVVGHTDSQGSFSYNMGLSERRAAAVVDVLVNRFGIERSRLSPVGVSYASPVASNRMEEGRAKNRRVALVEE